MDSYYKSMIGSFKKRYNSLALPVKAGLWFTIAGFLQKAMSFLTMPIFTRLLSTNEYGIVTIYNSWESIFLIVITLNIFFGIFNTAMVEFKEERNEYASSLVGFIFITSISCFLIYFLLEKFVNSITGMDTFLTVMMFVQIFFQGVVSIWIARLKFDYDYIPVTITTFILFALSPIISILGIILMPDYKVEAKIGGNVIAYIMVGAYAIKALYEKGKSFYNSRYWKYAIMFGSPLIVHYLSSVVLGQCDRILIGRFCGDNFAALYAVAYSVAMILTIFTSSANQAVVPWLYKHLECNQLETTKKPIYILLFSTVLLLLLVMLLGPEIIKILATPDYYDAKWVIPPIMASVLFTFIYMLFANIEFFYKKNNYIVISSVSAALLNLVLNFIFIPRFGYYAASYTTLVCYMLFGLSHYAFARHIAKTKKIEWPYKWSILFILSIILQFFTFLALVLYNTLIVRYIVMLVILISICCNYKYIIKFYKQIKIG